jgi:hypothetical protein
MRLFALTLSIGMLLLAGGSAAAQGVVVVEDPAPVVTYYTPRTRVVEYVPAPAVVTYSVPRRVTYYTRPVVVEAAPPAEAVTVTRYGPRGRLRGVTTYYPAYVGP